VAILFDRDFGRVWSDGATPCVFSSITRAPGKQELDDLAEKQIEMIREVKREFTDVYFILDLQHSTSMARNLAEYYFSTLAPRQFKTGVRHMAVVMPEEKTSQETVLHSLIFTGGLSISTHPDFEKALAEINLLRTEGKSSPGKKSIFHFLSPIVS
jgi:hypothetical protein